MEKKIIWERWDDPLKSAIDDYKSVIKDTFDEHIANEHVPPEMVLDRAFPIRGPILLSNMGPIPIHEANTPSKIFNFWIGHANFYITEDIAETICEVQGVEVFNVWSPYRFRLGIAKAFVDRDVMHDINKVICGAFTTLEGGNLVKFMAENLKKSHNEFYIVNEQGRLVFLDTKPKGVDTLYDYKKSSKKTGTQPRTDGGDEKSGQQEYHKKGD